MAEAIVEVVVVQAESLQEPEQIPTVPTCYNDECVICWEDIKSVQEEGQEVVVFPCMHQLCRVCVVGYLQSLLKQGLDITCPLCRTVMLDSKSEKYQEHRLNYYKHCVANQPIEVDQTHQHTRHLYQERQRLQNQMMTRVMAASQRRNTNRCLWSLPCVIILMIMVTLFAVYQGGLLK